MSCLDMRSAFRYGQMMEAVVGTVLCWSTFGHFCHSLMLSF